MTPKEKANELWYKFYNKLEHTFNNDYNKYAKEICKQLALLCVDELIKQINLPEDEWFEERLEYLENVKDELNKL